MNDLNNIEKHIPDDVDLHDAAEQGDETVVEVESEDLEQVAGGGDGTAVGVGKN